jgi:class 3 adenylate cyclase
MASQEAILGYASRPVSGFMTLLFADMRGYTRFTAEHGDEAAARLAMR